MRYIKIGERIGIVTVLELGFDGEQRTAKCICDCGKVYEKRTDYLRRRRGLTEVSCGCLRRAMNREKMADARAKLWNRCGKAAGRFASDQWKIRRRWKSQSGVCGFTKKPGENCRWG